MSLLLEVGSFRHILALTVQLIVPLLPMHPLCTGGTSGCVVAGRLAVADPSLSILVIEAGPPTRDDDLHTQPARYRYHLRPETTTIKFHPARESAALGGRGPIVPSGQCVGGGSSVNCTCINFSCFLSTAQQRKSDRMVVMCPYV